jgi:hypothetical protein
MKESVEGKDGPAEVKWETKIGGGGGERREPSTPAS